MAKVLVTGSSGQLGSYLCELLVKNHDVTGLDIRPQTYESIKPVSVVGSITDEGAVKQALRGTGVVVHCAAQVSVEKATKDPLTDANANVLGTLNMLHQSVVAGVEKFVYISSASVFGQPKYVPIDENHPTHPTSNYGVSKLSGEKYTFAYAANSNMVCYVVRPFNFYSPRADPESPYSGVITKFVTRVKAGKAPIIEGDGRQTRDFIHARDVAEMIKLVIEAKGQKSEAFNCGSGTSTSVLDLANRVIDLSGKRLKPEFASPRVGDIRDSIANMMKSKNILGFKARIGLDEGLRELLS